jgi:hypothetical protein
MLKKITVLIVSGVFMIMGFQVVAEKKSLIIDHNCIDISKVPFRYIKNAKKKFKIAYGHTSHGSQVVSGMKALSKRNKLFSFNRDGSGGALEFIDRTPQGDLGNPDRETWAKRTRELLEKHDDDINMIMWSWCGQVGWSKKSDIIKYLNLMNELEKDFPEVTFVYMTGHLDGSGEKGRLHKRNEQIRKFCIENGKVLYDFADIESYSPDGKINYMKLFARDTCDYRKKHGEKANWAEEWINKNPKHRFALPGSAAHTHPLNGAMKGEAFWWMLAELAGWKPRK